MSIGPDGTLPGLTWFGCLIEYHAVFCRITRFTSNVTWALGYCAPCRVPEWSDLTSMVRTGWLSSPEPPNDLRPGLKEKKDGLVDGPPPPPLLLPKPKRVRKDLDCGTP